METALQVRGRPWPRGVSGNPRGRAPRGAALAEHLRCQLAQVTGEDGRTTRAEELARVLIQLALDGDMQAIRTVLERVDGKVPDSLALTGAGGGALSVVLRWPENPELT